MTYLGSKFTNQVGTVQVNEGVSNEFRHALDTCSVGPVGVMDGSESNGPTLKYQLGSTTRNA
jgi:hypothetical protein